MTHFHLVFRLGFSVETAFVALIDDLSQAWDGSNGPIPILLDLSVIFSTIHYYVSLNQLKGLGVGIMVFWYSPPPRANYTSLVSLRPLFCKIHWGSTLPISFKNLYKVTEQGNLSTWGKVYMLMIPNNKPLPRANQMILSGFWGLEALRIWTERNRSQFHPHKMD